MLFPYLTFVYDTPILNDHLDTPGLKGIVPFYIRTVVLGHTMPKLPR